MPYRQGLMVARGDYYGRAAAGGIFDVIGGIAKTALGLATGGPIGAARALVSVLTPAQKQNPIGATLPPPVPIGRGISIGGSKGIQIGSFPQPPQLLGPGPGGTGRFGPAVHEKKRRRMNVTNVKALRRAGRRVVGFEKLARRFVGFASPHRPKGRIYFRRKAKR